MLKAWVFVSNMRNIIVFYFFLLVVYFFFFGHSLITALVYPDVLIFPIMALGSFVAGSTFLGGGAVAFPALTKILLLDPVAAKTFSFAIQSVGMTSASIYILRGMRNFPFKIYFSYILGSLIGLIACLFYFQYTFLPTDIRIGFTLFLCCSLGLYLWAVSASKIDIQEPVENDQACWVRLNSQQLFVVTCSGFVGGFLSGLIGSGADLVVFSVLTLYFRLGLKFSIKVSVVTMASVSIIGLLVQLLFFPSEINKISNLWYLAAPVVILGAPLGAFFCRRISPKKLLVFMSVLVAIETISTFFLLKIDINRVPFYVLIMMFLMMVLFQVYKRSPYNNKRTVSAK